MKNYGTTNDKQLNRQRKRDFVRERERGRKRVGQIGGTE